MQMPGVADAEATMQGSMLFVSHTTISVVVSVLAAAATMMLYRFHRFGSSVPPASSNSKTTNGEVAAAAAAADTRSYPWHLPGGSFTQLQAAQARLAIAMMLHSRLSGNAGCPAQKSKVTGLVDLIQMVGEHLEPRSPAARAAAEETTYHTGWSAPNWMDTTDMCGGFRQMIHYPQFRLAVSKSGRLQGDVRDVCPPPAGWRLATSADIIAAGMRRFAPTKSPKQYIYMDQAGWTCCTWPERSRVLPGLPWQNTTGVERIYFVTADWDTVEPADGGSLHAQYTEGTLSGSFTAASLRSDLAQGLFAGIVCVRED